MRQVFMIYSKPLHTIYLLVLIFLKIYLKFLYKPTISIDYSLHPNILFIGSFTSIIFIEITTDAIKFAK